MTEYASAPRTVRWIVRETTIGPMLLAATEQGLVNVVFRADEPTVRAAVDRLADRLARHPVRAGEDAGQPSRAGEDSRDSGHAARAGEDSRDSGHATPAEEGGGPPATAPAEHAGDAEESRHLATAIRELDAYFSGALHDFTVALDWSLTTGFNREVLRELAAGVPYGTVVGYQTLADRIGKPGSARAIGMAMGANPLPIVVPCHRVVESDGGIGGFGGGLEIKRALLALEGVLPEPLF